MELTAAYGMFANGGIYNEPVVITKIVDWKGKVLRERFQDARQATSPEVAYLMTSMMQSVIQHGTARALRVLERPAAGKTGTTNDYDDAWFVGYTPELVTGVWVGRDDNASLGDGETGGKVAAPIWLDFMKEATKDQPITVAFLFPLACGLCGWKAGATRYLPRSPLPMVLRCLKCLWMAASLQPWCGSGSRVLRPRLQTSLLTIFDAILTASTGRLTQPPSNSPGDHSALTVARWR